MFWHDDIDFDDISFIIAFYTHAEDLYSFADDIITALIYDDDIFYHYFIDYRDTADATL